jgi:hypothetical protein
MEEWKPVHERPGYYFISTLGRVKNDKNIILKQHTDASGYRKISLYISPRCIKVRLVHRLVAHSFLPNTGNLPLVNHIDGDRSNNCVANLEWVTAADNNTRKVHPCTNQKGRKIIQLTLDNVELKQWDKIVDAANKLGLSAPRIGQCCIGKQHSHGGFKWKYLEDEEKANELWRPVPGCKTGAEISSLGRIRSRNLGISIGVITQGYSTFYTHKVHRLVALAFPELCPNDDPLTKIVVNHIDGNKLNNCADNLEWVTISRNCLHAHDIGLNTRRKEVWAEDSDGDILKYPSIQNAAKDLCLLQSGISGVCRGLHKTHGGFKWYYAPKDDAPAPKKEFLKLSDEDVVSILNEYGFDDLGNAI